MKIHAKLGGVTHTVPMPNVLGKDTMMMGADVRPSPSLGPFSRSLAYAMNRSLTPLPRLG